MSKMGIEEKRYFDDIFSEALRDSLHRETATSATDILDPTLYNVIPPSVRVFNSDPKYLGGFDNLDTGIMTILEALEAPGIRKARILAGKGSGKSVILRRSVAYRAYRTACMKDPQGFYGLSKGEKIAFVNVSVGRSQVKHVVFAALCRMLQASPAFVALGLTELTSHMEVGENVVLYAGSSSSTEFLGFPTMAASMDEADFMVDSANRNVARDLEAMLLGSMETRFPNHHLLVAVSSRGSQGAHHSTTIDQAMKILPKVDIAELADKAVAATTVLPE